MLKNPQLAEEDKILATPTLSKILPPPVRRIIGDLSDRERVLIGLDLLLVNLVLLFGHSLRQTISVGH